VLSHTCGNSKAKEPGADGLAKRPSACTSHWSRGTATSVRALCKMASTELRSLGCAANTCQREAAPLWVRRSRVEVEHRMRRVVG